MTGRCLCGGVRFTLDLPLDFLGHCHCRSCRLSHGAPFVTWAAVPFDRFHLEADETLAWYASSEWIEWGFCRVCGSNLLYRVVKKGHPEDAPLDKMYVSAGSLEGDLGLRPTTHVSYEERVPWLDVHDGLPKRRGKTRERMGDDER
jgi:hypothetical protein